MCSDRYRLTEWRSETPFVVCYYDGYGTVVLAPTVYLSQLRAKLRDWAVRPVRAGCYSWAALCLIDSKTL